ncbi:hypothetical protein M406DRAFT_38912, partial [Cryphonectria parasitica EP155]
AQSMKSSTTTIAQAVQALNADRRLMVTATPIQNRLSELFSLFHFLRFYPHIDHRSLTWGSGDPEEDVKRLKQLLGFIMHRRLNGILSLPKGRI